MEKKRRAFKHLHSSCFSSYQQKTSPGNFTTATNRYYLKLLSTLPDSAEICYGAANWISLGETRGRGRMDRHHETHQSTKLIFVLPLHRECRAILCAQINPVNNYRRS